MAEAKTGDEARTIFTVGHSTRSLGDFIAILKAHGIQALADVRQYPRSRRLPHFNDESLSAALLREGIDYLPFKSLGGRRKANPDSINTGWRNENFRGYADFMQTGEFTQALKELMDVAVRRTTAVMCAEAMPWRCHRSLIADALVIRGWEVLDIMDANEARPHRLPSFARVDGMRLTYPAEAGMLFEQTAPH
jgi:uncharacterized protein (DUF488 family)